MPHYRSVPHKHWDLAQKMRHDPTRAEKTLWRVLRKNQHLGPFRRQHPIGPYIVDFVCLSVKLIIELDGDVHVFPEQVEHDKRRDEYLRNLGFRIRHYPNPEVLQNIDGVMLDIMAALQE